MSERRMNRLNNKALSVGLPDFLTKGAGMFSGMMLSQYTADMMIVEQRILSMPASIQSIPAAADQEDFVSMGMNTAIKNNQILDNAYGVLGIELMAAAQALDFRKEEYSFGKGVQAAKDVIRKHVEFLDIDRPLYPDHTTMQGAGKIMRDIWRRLRRRSVPLNREATVKPRHGMPGQGAVRLQGRQQNSYHSWLFSVVLLQLNEFVHQP